MVVTELSDKSINNVLIEKNKRKIEQDNKEKERIHREKMRKIDSEKQINIDKALNNLNETEFIDEWECMEAKTTTTSSSRNPRRLEEVTVTLNIREVIEETSIFFNHKRSGKKINCYNFFFNKVITVSYKL